ncbi:MAG: GDP-mannose 4,6-dehydratase [Desulfobacterales bacterium]|nr:GDP-mannose 4,6-dehydratase [Desulfobacterales bacterium]
MGKLCVIGSNSFSGAWFVKVALEQGWEVMGISRSAEPEPPFLPYAWGEKTGFQFKQWDLNHDLGAIGSGIRAFRPNVVVNFAAQSMVGQSWEYPDHWYRTNVLSSVGLVEKLASCDFLEKYIHVSTPEVYGNCRGQVVENTQYAPSTPYAVSRAAFDMHLSALHRSKGFPVVFTRAANVFGPGQQLYRIVPKAMVSFLKGERLPLHGGGRSVRSFIHIEDVCKATLGIIGRGEPGQIFHISTREMISIHDLVVQIADLVGVSFEDHVEITRDRLGKDDAYLLDSSALRRLGWEESVSLTRGLGQTLDWVKHHFKTLKTLPMEYVHKP